MPMIRPSDVLAAVKRFWDADAALIALVPGGLHFGRVSDTHDASPIKAPYAVAKITEGEAQWNSSLAYVQPWTIELRVWSEAGPEDAGKIHRALDVVFDRDRYDEMFLDSGRVLDLRALPGELSEDDARKDAKDQMILARHWEVLVQG